MAVGHFVFFPSVPAWAPSATALEFPVAGSMPTRKGNPVPSSDPSPSLAWPLSAAQGWRWRLVLGKTQVDSQLLHHAVTFDHLVDSAASVSLCED